MSRTADSTIKGFLYQFNLTLNKILSSSDIAEIQVEGIIEDIDITTGKTIQAIQCKYHGLQTSFKLSAVYKPILQMLKHYTQNTTQDITYILYCYFPSVDEGKRELTLSELNEILNTENTEYIANYITVIKPPMIVSIKDIVAKAKRSADDKRALKNYYTTNQIDVSCNLETFLNDRFEMVVGKSYEELESETQSLMINDNFTAKDVEELFYPNAIQYIAEVSTNVVSSERIITKNQLIEKMTKKKKTAISRWTREVTFYRKLLKKRQLQLAYNLNTNNRIRYFIIDPSNFSDFSDNIVLFIKDYIDCYCHKPKLHNPPLFLIEKSIKADIDGIVARLYTKGIEAETGYRGSDFYNDAFLSEPERKIKDSWIQFRLRISEENDILYDIINQNKPDDMFIISNQTNEKLDFRDVNCEILDVNNFNELRYLLKINKEI